MHNFSLTRPGDGMRHIGNPLLGHADAVLEVEIEGRGG